LLAKSKTKVEFYTMGQNLRCLGRSSCDLLATSHLPHNKWTKKMLTHCRPLPRPTLDTN